MVFALGGVAIGRSIAAPASTQSTVAKAEADAGLDHVVKAVDFQDMPLRDAIASLQKQTDANIAVHWTTLDAVGIDPNATINLRLRDQPLRRVLEVMCTIMGGESVAVHFKAENGIIHISTENELPTPVVMRMYDVRDLLEDDHKLRLHLGLDATSTGGGGSGSGQQLFSSSSDPYAAAMSDLTTIVTDQVDPESWRDAGGSIGSIRDFDGRMIVTTTPAIHEKVAKLLETIRKG